MNNETILNKLKDGNKQYVKGGIIGDVSKNRRIDTYLNGQSPFALIITCSDSRVIPEVIFQQGIGDLFVVRVAGNVVDEFVLGSIEYAIEHLNITCVVVLGHKNCGAVSSCLNHASGRYVNKLIERISQNIKNEKDYDKAIELNVKAEVLNLKQAFATFKNVEFIGSIYDIETGNCIFL